MIGKLTIHSIFNAYTDKKNCVSTITESNILTYPSHAYILYTVAHTGMFVKKISMSQCLCTHMSKETI